jgi:sugar phosphate isomerase/epimerase
MSMIIGAQGYTIHDFTQTPEDIRESLRKISNIGYTCLQVSGFGPFDAAWLHEAAMENHLDIAITHTNPDRILHDTDNVAKEHQILGCRHVGIGSMPKSYERNLEGYRAFIRDYTKAARILHKYGLKFHYHNHQFEFERYQGLVAYDVLIAETDPELWGFIPDTYWIQVGGRNPAKQLEMLKGRVQVCHLKDLLIYDGETRMAPVFEGNLDWREILSTCGSIGVEYLMVEQDYTYDIDPFEALRISYDNLKKAGY